MVIYCGNRLVDLFYNIFVVRWLYEMVNLFRKYRRNDI